MHSVQTTKQVICGLFKPSDGLEPSAPSLPSSNETEIGGNRGSHVNEDPRRRQESPRTTDRPRTSVARVCSLTVPSSHGGRSRTLRGRQSPRPPPASRAEPPAEQEESEAPDGLEPSTPSLPSQPRATVFGCFGHFFGLTGSPPIATGCNTGLHKAP